MDCYVIMNCVNTMLIYEELNFAKA
jgi:hypothetical protein